MSRQTSWEVRGGRGGRRARGAGPLGLVLLAACGGGSGGKAPRVGFASGSETLLESDASVDLVVELDLASGPLDEEVTVQVRDRGTGSATGGVDYVELAPAMLVFPAGAADGEFRTVTVTSIADDSVEGTETIVLELFQAEGAKIATATATVSIADDDVPGSLLVTADPGSGSIELSPGSTIDFGTRAIDAGPSADVVVTVANQGDSLVSLSAVTLIGADAQDFAVTVGGDATAGGTSGLPATVPRRPSPLFALGGDGPRGLSLVLDGDRADELRGLARVRLEGFALPGIGEVDLDLEQLPSPWAAGAVVRVGGEAVGLARDLAGDVSTWRGRARGYPGSSAFLSFSRLGTRGWLRLSGAPEDLFFVVAETSEAATPAGAESRIARPAELDPGGTAALGEFCLAVRAPPDAEAASGGGAPPTAATPSVSLLPATCRVAFESDFQFWQRFGDTSKAVLYVTQLLSAVNDRYAIDVQTRLEGVYLSLHDGPTAASDPWEASDDPLTMTAGDLLDEFEQQWSPMFGAPLAPAAQYDIAHFLSGSQLGGGIAYVDVLCHPNFNLGVSTEMTGTIDFDAFSGQPDNLNWDFVVVAHEIGHNFDARHTHEYCPPLDLCQPNTEGCPAGVTCATGTLMSYCHLCPGATANILLEFHPQVANIMRQAVNASCLESSGLPGGASALFTVRFDPDAPAGSKSASLRLAHDAQNPVSPFLVGLTGEAVDRAP